MNIEQKLDEILRNQKKTKADLQFLESLLEAVCTHLAPKAGINPFETARNIAEAARTKAKQEIG